MTNLRKEAEGRSCLVRIPGICNCITKTTVLAHLNGAGMGRKHHDMHGAWACSACHEWLDGGYIRHGVSKDERDLDHLRAMVRTQKVLIEEGKL